MRLTRTRHDTEHAGDRFHTPRRITRPARAHRTTPRPDNWASTSAATCSARRVLPTPPIPVNVTTRAASSRSRLRSARVRGRRTPSAATADSPGTRPANATPETRAGRSGCTTWNTRSGRARSRRRCSPRSTSYRTGELVARPVRRSPATQRSARRAPTAISRAARFTARAVIVAVAELGLAGMDPHPHPQRLRRRPTVRGDNATCAATAAATASCAPSRTRRGTRRPLSSRRNRHATSTASRTISSWRANAGCITSGCSSHRRVEPSTSVNKNVTVPDGSWELTSSCRGDAPRCEATASHHAPLPADFNASSFRDPRLGPRRYNERDRPKSHGDARPWAYLAP